jgi:hypothetical protein
MAKVAALDVRLRGLAELRETVAEASWHLAQAERLLVGLGEVTLTPEAVPRGHDGDEDSSVQVTLEASGKGRPGE